MYTSPDASGLDAQKTPSTQVGLIGLDRASCDAWRQAAQACGVSSCGVCSLAEGEALAHSTTPTVLIVAAGDFAGRLADPKEAAFRRTALIVVTRANSQHELISTNAVGSTRLTSDPSQRAMCLRDALAEAAERLETWVTIETFHQSEATLTEHEREVYRAVIAGRLNKQIASDLGVSVRTVEQRRRRVFEKMRVESAVPLAALTARVQTVESLASRGAISPVASVALEPRTHAPGPPPAHIRTDSNGYATPAVS